MNAIALSCITFVCISGGALLGMFLPGHHLSTDDKDVVRLGTGLIGTIAALVLGLLIASAKGSYDTQSTQVTQMTSNVVLLDNLLAQYGPETNDVRNLLRRGIVVLADRMWREKSSEVANANPFEASAASQGNTDRHRHCANPPAAVRTDEQLNPYAVPGGADFLAHHHLWKLRPVCQTQRNRFRLAVRFCTVGRRGDLPSPGAGSAICGFDANFQRATAQRPHAAQSLSHSHDRGCRPEQGPTIASSRPAAAAFRIDQDARCA